MKNLKNSILAGFLAMVFILTVVLSPLSASASGEKFFLEQISRNDSSNWLVFFAISDAGSLLERNITFTSNTLNSEDTLMSDASTAVLNWAHSNGYSGAGTNDIFNYKPLHLATVATTGSYTDLINLPTSPSSYQTIVSQTGTSAPAVSGGMTPVNTYSGTTFTWARTGAGVYTITASQAVFNTSGKTGVFIAPLQNLNASVRGVVTSSTVITVTTAVQSVAVLGLLGLTTTATDVLLTNTMIYIQTYP